MTAHSKKEITIGCAQIDCHLGDIDKNIDKHIAITYGMPVVLCNRVGKEETFQYWGESRILDPYGKILIKAGADEELIHARLNYDDVKNARYSLPIVRDCRIDTTIRELTKVAKGDLGDLAV